MHEIDSYMNHQTTYKNMLPAISLLLVAALSRFIPHPFNFTAVGAMALFAGANFKDKRIAYLMPITIMLLTDLILGLHTSMIPVYGCFAFTVFLGTQINGKASFLRVGTASILSSVIFFLVTNLPLWYLDQGLYPMTWAGTMESYTMAIPFFNHQVLGDLFYNAVLFGSYSLYLSARRVKA